MNKRFVSAAIITVGVLLPMVASAHVVVKPGDVGVGAFATFTTGVPNEKEQTVTGLRLVIPAGLQHVSPNVKPGWTIGEQKSGTGEDATVTEINWTGGQIPAGQRDDFAFSAQAPATAGELHWKAYQTYADGTVVAWDQTPSGKDDESVTPYSTTRVVNDLAGSNVDSGERKATSALTIAVVALALSVVGFVRRRPLK
jgi:uncharacterized protein YcnI